MEGAATAASDAVLHRIRCGGGGGGEKGDGGGGGGEEVEEGEQRSAIVEVTRAPAVGGVAVQWAR